VSLHWLVKILVFKTCIDQNTEVIEANCHARLNYLKELLNDVIFIWFSDKKLSH